MLLMLLMLLLMTMTGVLLMIGFIMMMVLVMMLLSRLKTVFESTATIVLLTRIMATMTTMI
eukprot:8323068-Pyramimonas_sp.AAC.1